MRAEGTPRDIQMTNFLHIHSEHLTAAISPYGAALARLEGRVFFEEILRRWPDLALAGEPTRQRSNLNNSLKTLPVHIS